VRRQVLLSARWTRDCTIVQPIRTGNAVDNLTALDIHDFIGMIVLAIISALLGSSVVLGSLGNTVRQCIQQRKQYDGLAKGHLFMIDRYLYIQRTGRTICAQTEPSIRSF